ncbi:FtsJ-domain-containing protein [Ascobolus immersus RN42]|uniref:FtsJ-domain-containing protein n=1 Tax=Ascobolus immersus RN42 TaxID=1160509 RepID=A0A3N4IIX7_ASCIM|nr:FtsJ-domain-containing protein [Ascobolus immersus RN42]
MGKSSKDKRDAYYRLAKEQSYRARSAFKLLHLATIFPILPNPPTAPTFALDLCAAPGSWSQVLSQRLHPDSKILALDLQPISPIPGVIAKQADITHPSTVKLIADVFGGNKAKLVVCDGAPDVMGLHDMDAYIQEELLLSALQLAKMVMDDGATFVAKIFRGQGELERGIWERMCGEGCFDRVTIAKPRSSRASSLEAFLVAEGWNGKRPEGMPNGPEWDFVACGDLADWDSDATFVLEEGREVKDPVQSPVAPPYKKAIERRRLLGGQASSIDPEKKREILGV